MKNLWFLFLGFILLAALYGCGQQTSTATTTTTTSTTTSTTPTATNLSTVEGQKIAKAVMTTFGINNLLTGESGKVGTSGIRSLSVRAQEITTLTREASGDWEGWWDIVLIDTNEAENEQISLDAHARIWIQTATGESAWEITREADFDYVDMDYDPLDSIPNNIRKVSLAGIYISTSTSTRAADYYQDKIVAGAPLGKIGDDLIFVDLENVTTGPTQEIAVTGQVSLYWKGPDDPLTNATQVLFNDGRINLSTGYPEAGAPAIWVYATGITGQTPNPILSGDIYFTGGNNAYIRIIAHGSDWESYYYRFDLDNGEAELILSNPPGPGPGTYPSTWNWYGY